MSYKIENISVKFDDLLVLDKLSMEIEKHKVTCILGPSGCGKTTLLNLISGIIRQNDGNLEGFDGNLISYLFQEPRLLNWKTIEQNIEYVLDGKYPEKEIKTIIEKYLEIVQLTKYRNFYPEKISGGMQQRAAIARAFAYPSEILLMDEPFKSLDLELKLNLYECFLKMWKEDKRTVLFVTHDIHDAIMLGDEIFLLSKKPTNIREKISNTVPHLHRNLMNQELLNLEKILYSKLILS